MKRNYSAPENFKISFSDEEISKVDYVLLFLGENAYAESPGNIGSWLGLKIIKSYMKNNPNESIQTLFKNNIKSSQFLIKSNILLFGSVVPGLNSGLVFI